MSIWYMVHAKTIQAVIKQSFKLFLCVQKSFAVVIFTLQLNATNNYHSFDLFGGRLLYESSLIKTINEY